MVPINRWNKSRDEWTERANKYLGTAATGARRRGGLLDVLGGNGVAVVRYSQNRIQKPP